MSAWVIKDKLHRKRDRMKQILLICLLLIFFSSTYAGEHGEHNVDTQISAEFAQFIREMNEGMEKMMKTMHSHGYTGNPDVDFLSMMIPHHEGAVEMARLILIYGNDPLTRKLAEEIIASQKVEIEAMKKRLEILKQRPDPEPGGFPALGGTKGRDRKK